MKAIVSGLFRVPTVLPDADVRPVAARFPPSARQTFKINSSAKPVP
jgi:hypothetical protein